MLSNTATPKYYGQFRDAVLRGDIIVGEYISMEMNRIDALIANPTIYYDDEKTDGWIEFCENELVLPNGRPLKMLDTFKVWGEQVYGWYYFKEQKVYIPGHGRQKGRYVKKLIKKRLTLKQFLIIARSNAKTLYESCHMAYDIALNPETVQNFVTAPTTRQAEEIINPIKTAMALSNGPLFKFMTDGDLKATRGNIAHKPALYPTRESIVNTLTNSRVEVRPMDIDKFQGFQPHLTAMDEWLSGDTREDIIAAIEQGAAKNSDYLILAVSSEGTIRNGVGDDIKMELVKILNGEYVNPHVSIWYYKQDNETEIDHPETWQKSNPNIGITVPYEAIQLDVERAQANPMTRNDILAKRFNLPMEGWTYFFTYDEIQPHPYRSWNGGLCGMGMDLSLGNDFCAFSFVFPMMNEYYGLVSLNFITDLTLRKLPPALAEKYQSFIKEGSLIVMDDVILDMDKVYDYVDQFITENDYNVVTVGYDPYNATTFITRWIQENGQFGVIKVPQGYKTESVPLGDIKTLAEQRRLLFHQEIVKFTMGNSSVLVDTNGNRKLYKARNDKKIDSVAATMDAFVAIRAHKELFI